MNYLLDTHVLIWLVTDQHNIPSSVMNELEDTRNDVFVSSISFWEVALKFSSGKLKLNGFLPQDLPVFIKSVGFEAISLSPEIASSFNNLTNLYHRDPFDRMLIWQAINEGYTLITKDEIIKKYKSAGLKTLW